MITCKIKHVRANEKDSLLKFKLCVMHLSAAIDNRSFYWLRSGRVRTGGETERLPYARD
jgi:hypothetical protein